MMAGPFSSVLVNAEFDHLDGTPPFTREVALVYDIKRGWVRMRGGPTGYEELPARAFRLDFADPTKPWAACFGTTGRWDRCLVSAAEMNRAGRELGLI